MRIIYTLLFVAIFMGQAWADDYSEFMERNDKGNQILLPGYIGSDGSITIYDERAEILSILERCLEFVRDGKEDLNRVEVTYSVYYPTTLLSIAKGEAKEAKEKVERLERETALRRDIEEMLQKLHTSE
jgi:hypothetical protein